MATFIAIPDTLEYSSSLVGTPGEIGGRAVAASAGAAQVLCGTAVAFFTGTLGGFVIDLDRRSGYRLQAIGAHGRTGIQTSEGIGHDQEVGGSCYSAAACFRPLLPAHFRVGFRC
jgi:hypothetical protein